MTSERRRLRRTEAAQSVRGLFSAAALMFALVACSSTQAPLEQSATEVPARTATVDAHSLLAAMLDPADENAVSSALASLPPPLTLTTRSVPNLHTRGVTDQIDSLGFGAITIEVYRAGGGGQPLLSAVQLNVGAVRLYGLEVGMSVAELYERFGRPAFATNADVVFRISPPTTSPFELSASLDDESVTALRWSAYLD